MNPHKALCYAMAIAVLVYLVVDGGVLRKGENGMYEEQMTTEALLRAWDAGETIWSIEMGGLGPGYEQAIQVLAIEMVRDNIGKPLPKKGEPFDDWGDATVERIDQKDPETGKYACGGFSGAQVGAAKQIAYHLIDRGPKGFYDFIPEDRRIQVSNLWPRVPA